MTVCGLSVAGRSPRPRTPGKRRLWQPIWTFFNSQVGGWLLSTVLVGSAAFVYAQYTDYRRKHDDRRTQRQKILVELSFRTNMYENVKRVERSKGPDFDWKTKCRRVLDGQHVSHVYPDIGDRPLVSLLWELVFLCDEPEVKRAVRDHTAVFADVVTDPGDFTPIQLEEAVKSLRTTLSVLLPEG